MPKASLVTTSGRYFCNCFQQRTEVSSLQAIECATSSCSRTVSSCSDQQQCRVHADSSSVSGQQQQQRHPHADSSPSVSDQQRRPPADSSPSVSDQQQQQQQQQRHLRRAASPSISDQQQQRHQHVDPSPSIVSEPSQQPSQPGGSSAIIMDDQVCPKYSYVVCAMSTSVRHCRAAAVIRMQAGRLLGHHQ